MRLRRALKSDPLRTSSNSRLCDTGGNKDGQVDLSCSSRVQVHIQHDLQELLAQVQQSMPFLPNKLTPQVYLELFLDCVQKV